MATVLGDLRQATIDYLENNVTIDISPPVKPEALPPPQFEFTVRVTNTAQEEGGIGLVNVRYQVQLNPGSYPLPNLPLLIVPSGGSSIDANGRGLRIGISTDFFDFRPSDRNLSYLQMGESQSITFNGTANNNSQATFSLFVRIQADPDLNSIFPRNFTSARVERRWGFP